MEEVILNGENNSDENGISNASLEMAQLDEAVKFVRAKLCKEYQFPQLGIVCGSGFSTLINVMTDTICVDYKEIPFFPNSTIQGHRPQLAIGFLNGILTACLLGRLHYYEGHSAKATVFPIRLLTGMGIRVILLTNAAGALDQSFKVGDIMVIDDHINFLQLNGNSALRGENLTCLGPRFPSLGKVYHSESFDMIAHCAKKAAIPDDCIKRGVYVMVGGPAYETPAEVRFFRAIGGNVIGMSTASEAIAAAHADMIVVAFSLVTNVSISERRGSSKDVPEPSHEEVLQVALSRTNDIQNLIFHLAPQLYKLATPSAPLLA